MFYAVQSGVPESVEYLLRCPTTDTKLVDDAYKNVLDYINTSSNGENQTQIKKLFDSRGDILRSMGHTCCSKHANRGNFTAIKLKDLEGSEDFPSLDAKVASAISRTAIGGINGQINLLTDKRARDRTGGTGRTVPCQVGPCIA